MGPVRRPRALRPHGRSECFTVLRERSIRCPATLAKKGALTMATKSKPKSTAARKAKPAAAKAKTESKSSAAGSGMFTMPDPAQLAKYAKTLTPEQAFELYRANARLALDV